MRWRRPAAASGGFGNLTVINLPPEDATKVVDLAAKAVPTDPTEIREGPHQLFCQEWEESESGWGTRPDGFTLHTEILHITAFVRELRAREMEGKPVGYVPEEYSRPAANPFIVHVDEATFQRVKASTNGTWVHQWTPSRREQIL